MGVELLETYAENYRLQLKFSFFTKAMGTQQLCDQFGILSNDELLLLEAPTMIERVRKHSNVPSPPMYRLESVTPTRIMEFFKSYAEGTWPRYFRSSLPRPVSPIFAESGSIRELSAWDFVQTVHDPRVAVLVVFVSANCEACDEFAGAFREVAAHVRAAQKKAPESSLFRHLTVARIDQSTNEHPELVKGTPWLRYWPKGAKKKPLDVELRSVDSIIDYLEEQLAEESELEVGHVDDICPSGVEPSECAGQKQKQPIEIAQQIGQEKPRIKLSQPAPELAKGYLSSSKVLDIEKQAVKVLAPSSASTTLKVHAPSSGSTSRSYLSTEADLDEEG